MRRRGQKALAAGMAEVVPGEEGDEGSATGDTVDTGTVDVGTSGDDDVADYSSNDAGRTSGIQNLQLEVDILSAVAIDRIAEEIARRVAARAAHKAITSVTLATPPTIGFLRLHSALDAEVSSLEAMTDRVAGSAGGPESIQTADTTALAIPLIAAAPAIAQAVGAAPALVKKAAGVLRTLAATTAYSGRSNRARQVLLDAALARHLSAARLGVNLPEHALAQSEPGGLIGRVLKLQARCRQLQETGDASGLDAVVGPVDALASALFDITGDHSDSVPLAQQLMLADGVAAGLGEGHALLTSEIAFSGGSYRTRRWMFNFLFGKDGLTYNGGAGVTYFLFRGDDRTTLDSDTIYFATPHGRFRTRGNTEMEPTNIGRRGRSA